MNTGGKIGLFCFAVMLSVLGCTESGEKKESPDAGGDSDTGADTDTDTDIDTDTDVDTDTDTDVDTDTDTDVDADSDFDTELDGSVGTDDPDGGPDTDVCVELEEIENGTLDISGGIAVGAQATYTCTTGYHVSGQTNATTQATVTCQSTGLWSAVPSCVKVDCGAPDSPINYATPTYSATTYAATATYNCSTGYTGMAVQWTCGADGLWTGSLPSCTPVTCSPSFTSVAPLSVSCTSSNNYNSTCSFSCAAGYTLSGSPSRTCGSTGSWDGTTASCSGIQCGTLPSVSGATPTSTGPFYYPATVQYNCNAGTTGTPATYTCGTTGLWTGTPPSCATITCPAIPTSTGLTLSTSAVTPGTTVTASCASGYHLATGSSSYTCGSTGVWSPAIPPNPTCQFDWLYRRAITVTGGSNGLQLLVDLSTIDSTHAQTNGADIRFSTSSTGDTFNLPHYIDTWTSSVKKIWVRLNGTASTIYVFYGNSSAANTAIDVDSMFPPTSNLVVSGSSDLSGSYTYDYVTINSGGILRVGAGQVLEINAKKIVLKSLSYISGIGRGYSYASTTGNNGKGGTPTSVCGGGGGGYGGSGGKGGVGVIGTLPGTAGPTYGSTYSTSAEMGSSGGEAYDDAGSSGAGGGAVKLNAQEIVIDGRIEVDGAPGSAHYDNGGGGGSGGSILLVGNYVTTTANARFTAAGGNGSEPVATTYGGGGGGGGGRIKFFHDAYLSRSPTASYYNVNGGTGGNKSVAAHAAVDGSIGTTALDESAIYPIKSSVQAEQPM